MPAIALCLGYLLSSFIPCNFLLIKIDSIRLQGRIGAHFYKWNLRESCCLLRGMFRAISTVQLTNREMNIRTLWNTSERLRLSLLMIAIGVFIGFLAPFGMHTFNKFISIGYWSMTCLLGYWVFSPLHSLGLRILQPSIQNIWVTYCITLVFSSLIFSLLVPLLNMTVLSLSFDYVDGILFAFPQVLTIGAVLTLVSAAKQKYFAQQQQLESINQQTTSITKATVEQALAHKQLTDFLALLPIEKRGSLLCLEMDDHYLKVHTDKGQHLVLMRFKDALEKLSAFSGFQTHRSWWVAEGAISKINKQGRKYKIILTNHLQVPVSKTYEQKIRGKTGYHD